jgi:hypothetical protein
MIDIILCKDQMENVQIIDKVQYLRLTLREQLYSSFKTSQWLQDEEQQ